VSAIRWKTAPESFADGRKAQNGGRATGKSTRLQQSTVRLKERLHSANAPSTASKVRDVSFERALHERFHSGALPNAMEFEVVSL